MTTIPPEYLNQIVTGDARELAQRIPDESVDLILCDPVYWQIDDYRWVAELAQRILVSGGNLIAQAGNGYRYQCETVMRESKLDPRVTIAEVYPFGMGSMYKDKAFIGWKPHLWFSKGNRKGGWIVNRMYGGGMSKHDHAWQDSSGFFTELVDRLVMPDEIVLDPFTGSGTVPAVCKMLGRNYIGFEIDPDTAEKARERVRNTQPPLFVMPPSQDVMEFGS